MFCAFYALWIIADPKVAEASSLAVLINETNTRKVAITANEPLANFTRIDVLFWLGLPAASAE